ncbi:MAG: hypothetical protein LEGION0398_MBIBDBAK_00068 [Legionellaceae bacterium]
MAGLSIEAKIKLAEELEESIKKTVDELVKAMLSKYDSKEMNGEDKGLIAYFKQSVEMAEDKVTLFKRKAAQNAPDITNESKEELLTKISEALKEIVYGVEKSKIQEIDDKFESFIAKINRKGENLKAKIAEHSENQKINENTSKIIDFSIKNIIQILNTAKETLLEAKKSFSSENIFKKVKEEIQENNAEKKKDISSVTGLNEDLDNFQKEVITEVDNLMNEIIAIEENPAEKAQKTSNDTKGNVSINENIENGFPSFANIGDKFISDLIKKTTDKLTNLFTELKKIVNNSNTETKSLSKIVNNSNTETKPPSKIESEHNNLEKEQVNENPVKQRLEDMQKQESTQTRVVDLKRSDRAKKFHETVSEAKEKIEHKTSEDTPHNNQNMIEAVNKVFKHKQPMDNSSDTKQNKPN